MAPSAQKVEEDSKYKVSASESRLLAFMIAMNQSKLQIDYKAFAAATGLANASCASVRIGQVVRKLKSMTPEVSGADAAEPKAPQKGRKRANDGEGKAGKKKVKVETGSNNDNGNITNGVDTAGTYKYNDIKAEAGSTNGLESAEASTKVKYEDDEEAPKLVLSETFPEEEG